MKNLLKELNMTIRQFSEKYEIPYNTVRQWERGLNSPPKYVMNLLREKIDREKNGEQTLIFHEDILYRTYVKFSDNENEKLLHSMDFKGNENERLESWKKNLYEKKIAVGIVRTYKLIKETRVK